MTTNSDNGTENAPTEELRRSDSSSSLSASFVCAKSSSLEESCSSLVANVAWGETSFSRSIRSFNLSLSNLKDIKPKCSSLLKKGYKGRARRSSELELDNSQSLCSLVSSMSELKTGGDIFDKSFESDFDESSRWLKQL